MANRGIVEQERIDTEAQNMPESPISPGRKTRSRLRGRPMTKWIFMLVPLALAVLGYSLYERYFANRESTDDAQIDGHINPVAAKISGLVVAINVDDNQLVKAGTVVVQIDPRDYQVALDRAKADLAALQAGSTAAHTQVPITSTTTTTQITSASAALQQAEGAKTAAQKDVDAARARLGSAEARVREAQATYIKASQDLERLKQLVAKDEVSRQQYDAAVAAADAAQAARDSTQASVQEASRAIEAAQARVVEADARIGGAKAALEATQTAPQQVAITRSNAQSALARVEQAQAAVAQAQLNLEYTQVKAAIDGTVSERKVEVGQYVQPGQPLLAIVPLSDVWVTANFKESQLKNMHPGQRAFVSVDAYGGREYEGHVDSIAAATGAKFSLLPPENATGNYVKVVQRVPVKIVIDKGMDAQHPLRPGLSVEATVFTSDDSAGRGSSAPAPQAMTSTNTNQNRQYP